MTEHEWRTQLNDRLTAIEARMTEVETKARVDEVHRVNVENRLSSIEETLKRLSWLIIAGFVGAIVAFVVRGGLVT